MQELRGLVLEINADDSFYLTAQSIQPDIETVSLRYLEAHEWKALPRLDPPAGYVYLLHDVEDKGRYKIGYTNNPRSRIQVLKTATSTEIRVVHIIETDDAAGLERELHNRFDTLRKTGEWFDLAPDDVAKIRDWKTGVTRQSDYVTSLDYSRHSQSVYQYVSHEEPPDFYAEELPDYYAEELRNRYAAETSPNTTAESKRKLNWKSGCLIFFLLMFAGSLLSDLSKIATSGPQFSSARQNRPAIRSTVSTANRANVSTAYQASTVTYFVKTADRNPANVRACPRITANCSVIGGLLPGETVRQLEGVRGEKIGGTENWIKFRHNGKLAYIHSSVLSSSRVPTPTYYVTTENKSSARLRACPITSAVCRVIDNLLSGHAIRPQEVVAGQSIAGSVIWFKLRYNGGNAYIHSSLVTANL